MIKELDIQETVKNIFREEDEVGYVISQRILEHLDRRMQTCGNDRKVISRCLLLMSFIRTQYGIPENSVK